MIQRIPAITVMIITMARHLFVGTGGGFPCSSLVAWRLVPIRCARLIEDPYILRRCNLYSQRYWILSSVTCRNPVILDRFEDISLKQTILANAHKLLHLVSVRHLRSNRIRSEGDKQSSFIYMSPDNACMRPVLQQLDMGKTKQVSIRYV